MPIIEIDRYREADLDSLQPIAWSDSFLVGETNLDEDHLCLVAQLNAVYTAIREGFDTAMVRDLMRQLAADELDHLNHEIMVLRRLDYPLADDHEAEHNAIKTEMTALRQRADEIEMAELTRIALAAKGALLRHLVGHDSRFKSHLHMRMGM